MGKLYLLPNLLDESLNIEDFFPKRVRNAVEEIQGLICESEKIARRYLRKFLSHDEMAKMPLTLLNEHTEDLGALIAPLKKGEVWGLISDAGLPCIADPGAKLVWLAHQNNIEVEALIGPSSIILALQLSGFDAQNFSFHGYLPRKEGELNSKILELEKKKGTHLWIEVPYRSQKMLDLLKRVLKPNTRLCVAANLTMPTQKARSQNVSDWKKDSFSLGKEPAVFLINAP